MSGIKYTPTQKKQIAKLTKDYAKFDGNLDIRLERMWNYCCYRIMIIVGEFIYTSYWDDNINDLIRYARSYLKLWEKGKDGKTYLKRKI